MALDHLNYPATTAQGGFLVDPGIDGTVSSYTMIFDINVAAMGGYAALLQTDLSNANDAEFFMRKTGSTFGIGHNQNYDGAAALGEWHRVALTIDGDQMAKYIDGTLVDTQTITSGNLARFTLSDGGFLILADEDGETAPGSLNSFLFVDRAMTAAEIGALAGSDGVSGILASAPEGTQATQFDFTGETLEPSFGNGSMIDRAAPPVEPEPEPVAVTSRIKDMMVTPDAETMVIDLATVFAGNGLTYTVQTAEGEVVAATVADGKLSLDFHELGFSDVKITATDGDGNVASDVFRVRVAGEHAYTLAVLPDTQDYTDHAQLSHIFGDMTQWLVDQKDTMNIKFVMHVGDVTQNNLPGQWDIAEEALRKLDGKIPYSLLPGNHDQAAGGSAADHSSVYLDERFSPDKQEATNPDTFGGAYDQEPDSARNTYSTFEGTDGTKWLVLNMEFGPRDDVLRWAGDIIEGHLDHRVIIVSHSLTDYAGRHDPLGGPLYDEGAGYDYGIGRDPEGANDGETVYRELLAKYPNISMTFSGHIFGDGAETNVSYSQYGNPVLEMLVNYQNGISREITGNGNEALGNNGGNGAMRLIVIDPDNNTISTETYFTEFDDYLDGYRVKPETDRDGLTGEYRGHQETFTDIDVGTPALFSMAKAGDDLFVEAGAGKDAAQVSLDASQSLNPKSEGLTYEWLNADGDVVATGQKPSVELDLGKHELTLKVTAADGLVTTDKVVVVVRGDDTLLVENFNDGDAAGWSTGPDQGVAVGVGTAADFGIPALGANDKIGHVPALSSGEKFFLSPLPGVPAGTVITSYTLVYDIYVPLATASGYTALFQTDVNNTSDAELFIRKTGATTGGIGIGGNYPGAFQYDAWQRIAFVVADQGDGNVLISKYIEGQKVGEQTMPADRFAFDVSKGGLIFSDEDGENSNLYVSSLLITDKVYTDQEIADLGGAKAGGITQSAPSLYASQFDFNDGDLSPTYGPGHIGMGQGGETGPFLLKGTVFARPDAEDGMPAPEGALWDMSDGADNKLVWTGEGAQSWSNYVLEAGVTSMDNDTIGLVFYYQDDANYYRFTMDGETNRREIVKVQNGVETVLASTEMGYQFNVELKLKVAIVDGAINVFLGDKNVFGGPVVDAANPLTHGTVGLYSSGQRSSIFDDIAVTRADLAAHAGDDQRLFDTEGDGHVAVTLHADDSYGLTDIVSWVWTNEDGEQVATGKNPTVDLASGVNRLTLTVTDGSGRTSSDRVDVEVVAKDRLLVSDSFSSPASLSKWTIVDEGEMGGIGADGTSSDWVIAAGKLQQNSDLQSRELTWDGATNPDYWQRGWSPLGDGVNVLRVGTYALYNDPAAKDWDDYSVQATVQTPDNDGLGFLFHYTDNKNYYKLELDAEGTLDRDPGNGAGSLFNLIRMRDGIEEILGQVPGKYEPGKAFELRVDIVGNRITAFINGEEIFAYAIEDHGNEKGTVGLYSWGNQGLTFDDVTVVDLSGAEPPVGDLVLVGDENDNVLTGNIGDDQITGLAGDDTLSGAAGDDSIDAGAGDDLVNAGAGDDFVEGGDGDDDIQGAAGDDELQGGAGDDVIDGGEGYDTLAGDEGNDTLIAGEGDEVSGGAGDDVIMVSVEGGAPAVIDGGEGDDTVKLGGTGTAALGATTGVENLLVQAGSWSVAEGASYDHVVIEGGAAVVAPLGRNGSDTLVIEEGGRLTGTLTIQNDQTGLALDNTGTIDKTSYGQAINLYLGEDASSVTLWNREAGVIKATHPDGTGSAGLIYVSGSGGAKLAFNNAGLLEGPQRVFQANDFAGESFVLNNLSGGIIRSTGGEEATLRGNITTVNNAGRIEGGYEGFDARSFDVTYNNLAGGYIEGKHHAVTGKAGLTVNNEAGGVMIGLNGSAVNIDNKPGVENTVTVTNRGVMQGRSANLDDSDGDAIDTDGLANITNYGTIEGLGHNGYHKGEPNVSEGIAIGGGTIINRAGAEIYGYGRAIQVDNSSNGAAHAATLIVNDGLIQGDGHGPEGVDPADAARFDLRGNEAINLVGALADEIINNSAGRILGGLSMGGGNDRLSNSGLIAALGGSAIDMGDGDDVVNLYVGSSVQGEIRLGAGNDRITMNSGLGAVMLDAGDGDDDITTSDGNDVIHGGAGNDSIYAAAGDDTIFAGEGDDLILADLGNDVIDGGDGFDTLFLAQATGPISVDFAAGIVSAAGIGTDTFTNIENLLFGAGNDVITGGNGDDGLDGGDGNDTLKGGAGDDTLAGSAGDDLVDGGSGNDSVSGGVGNDTLKAGSGHDLVEGGEGDDMIDAGSGDDVIEAGLGHDVVDGGSGADRIAGGAGNDALKGGSGADVFVFAAAFGRDVISDFATSGPNADMLEFSIDVFADFASVMASATEVGGDVVFTVDDDTTLTLAHTKLASLGVDDFRFA